MSKKLTEPAIEKIPPAKAGKRAEFTDGATPGLRLRVTDKGHKSFRAELYREGKRHVIVLGTWPAMTLEEAKLAVKDARQALHRGIDPATARKANRVETVAHAAELLVERHYLRKGQKGAKPMKSSREAIRKLRHYVLPSLGDRQLRDITPLDIKKLHDRLAKENGPIMASRVLAAISKLYTWAAVQSEWLNEALANPVLPGLASGKAAKRDRFLDTSDLARLWEKSGRLAAPWRQFIRLLVLTGQRRGEVSNMRWADIDFETKVWTLPAIATKTNRRTEVPLSDLATAELLCLPRGLGPYVVSTTAGQKPISGFSKATAELRRKMGDTAAFTLHDLRRTVATQLSEMNVSRDTIKKILNHADNDVTAIYERSSHMAQKRAALDRLAAKLTAGSADNVVALRA